MSTLIALGVILGLLLALTRRPLTSAALTLYVAATLLIASLVKQSFLGMPMTLADLRFFLLRPAVNAALFTNYPLLGLALLALILCGIAISWAGVRLEPRSALLATPRRGRLLRAALVLLPLAAMTVGLRQPPPRAGAGAGGSTPDNYDAWQAFLTLHDMERPAGLLARLSIFFDNRDIIATLPPARVQQRFPGIDATADNAATAPSPRHPPDILMVLEESTFDPRLIARCPLRQCDTSLLHAPRRARANEQGALLVHSTGGGTWLSEFAFFTGFDWRVFGRGGAYAPVSLAPRLRGSLPLRLRAEGYRTIAICPTDGNFLSARSAYANYGFEEFHAAEDLGLGASWHTVRDATIFEHALRIAARSGDARPLFLFVMTIRNHGPHGRPGSSIPAELADVRRRTSAGLADYLGRMRDSAGDYAVLARRWLVSPRPRIIGWFGDHQPETAWPFTANPASLRADRLPAHLPAGQLQYLTRWQLSANYPAVALPPSRAALDLAYLGTQLLRFAGLPLDPAERASLSLAAQCHGLMLGCSEHDLVADYLSYRIHELGSVQ
ncbi:MAG: sulfatase-like hydrolase/transferase [Gammaproteobacteria bacterium]|nr:sulfatase-like hydrolase/transferase [Gammaproteobacteria bacterium]